jgi:hypothetical protein
LALQTGVPGEGVNSSCNLGNERAKEKADGRARLTSFQLLGPLDFARKFVRPGQRGLIDQR